MKINKTLDKKRPDKTFHGLPYGDPIVYLYTRLSYVQNYRAETYLA